MDYDDELRESCDKTGDLLHCRTNCAANTDKDGEMDEFAAEMESELDELLMTAQKQWTKSDKNEPSPKPDQDLQPTTSKSANELYEKGTSYIQFKSLYMSVQTLVDHQLSCKNNYCNN